MIIPMGRSYTYILDSTHHSHLDNKSSFIILLALSILSLFIWGIGFIYRKYYLKSDDDLDSILEYIGKPLIAMLGFVWLLVIITYLLILII